MFVNREQELAALQRWWDDGDAHLGLVWGRRRVGKTALLQHFATERTTVFHTAAGRPVAQELRLLARRMSAVSGTRRDFDRQPLRDWDDAIDVLVELWEAGRVLVVLDEFPELVTVSRELPGILRALLDRPPANAKLLLAGSAVRTMTAIQEARAPLYGRVDLSLQLNPFRPHEAALMLADLPPAERAQVWTIVGGVPLYLRWWDTNSDIAANVERLFAHEDGRLLLEGQFVLATEATGGDLSERVLRAIAAGRTKHSEINDAVHADATRTLERLLELRLVERLVPVTDDPRRTRRRIYRIADNFLAFWLDVIDRYRSEIERGLGASVASAIMDGLDRHAGPRWEAAVRDHLRRMAQEGQLGEQIVAIGPWWRDRPEAVEIDALALATERRRPVLAAEAKWTSSVDGARVARGLERKLTHVPGSDADVRLAVAARDEVTNPSGLLPITARDIFA
jgi:hypothetical protein